MKSLYSKIMVVYFIHNVPFIVFCLYHVLLSGRSFIIGYGLLNERILRKTCHTKRNKNKRGLLLRHRIQIRNILCVNSGFLSVRVVNHAARNGYIIILKASNVSRYAYITFGDSYISENQNEPIISKAHIYVCVIYLYINLLLELVYYILIKFNGQNLRISARLLFQPWFYHKLDE